MVTIRYADHAVSASQGPEFSRKPHVPVKQHEEFGWSALIVTEESHIASQQRQHFGGRGFLADGGHAQEC